MTLLFAKPQVKPLMWEIGLLTYICNNCGREGSLLKHINYGVTHFYTRV
jgi:hypothetical protein